MRAYSMDLRERVLADCDAGGQTRAVATKYRVSESWVRRLKQTRRDAGRVAPAAHAGGRTPGWVAHAAAIRAAVAAAPDATLAEFRQRFPLPLSRSALARALLALGLSREKSRSERPSRTART
jgi:transposase